MSNSGKKTVELASGATRPSIRRDPPPPPMRKTFVPAMSSEREAWTVAIGVVMFALAITFLILWFSDYTSK